jgi:hypothetical protein
MRLNMRKPSMPSPAKAVRRGARFESAAAHQAQAVLRQVAADCVHLSLVLDGARPGDQRQPALRDLQPAVERDDRRLDAPLARDELEGVRDAVHVAHSGGMPDRAMSHSREPTATR